MDASITWEKRNALAYMKALLAWVIFAECVQLIEGSWSWGTRSFENCPTGWDLGKRLSPTSWIKG
jgi:hypothetical protein